MKPDKANIIYLLPNKAKYFGIIFFFLGIALLLMRFHYGIKPEIFDWKVFAIYSSYLKSKYFTLTINHFFEEIAAMLSWLGLFFLAFSKEKNENERVLKLRFISLYYAFLVTSSFFFISIIFFYGLGFMYVTIFNTYSFLISYIIILKINIITHSHRYRPSSS